MNRKSKIIISLVGIFLVLLILTGFTYAYYLTRINGNLNNTSISVTTANLVLEYTDGNGKIVANNIFPGEDIDTKTFAVTNKGNMPIDYVVVVEDVVNTFSLRNDLIYTLTCKSVNKNTGQASGTCSGITNASFPIEDSVLINNSIPQNIRHEYTLKVQFVESNTDQSVDMNKTLNAKINIYDRKDYIPYLTDREEVKTYINEISNIENITDNYITNGVSTAEVGTASLSNNKAKVQLLADTTYLIDKNTWLLFSTISKANYDTSNWTEVAGPKDATFIGELKSKGIDITTDAFKNKKYLATDEGEYAGLVHFSAALAAYLYNTDYLVNAFGYTEEEFNDLAGWAGDLQTLIANNLLSQISNQNDYDEIYNKMSELIGKSGTYFDSNDLYADIDAVNLYALLNNYRTKTVKEVMDIYFTTQYKDRFSLFIKRIAGSLKYDTLREYIYHYTKYSSYWSLYNKSFSITVAEAAADAFTDYLWYKANNKELNIFTESLELKKGTTINFTAEYINTNNQKDLDLKNEDYTWSVTKKDGSACLSTIENGVLSVSSNETVNELLINVYLNKSNKVIGKKIIKLS